MYFKNGRIKQYWNSDLYFASRSVRILEECYFISQMLHCLIRQGKENLHFNEFSCEFDILPQEVTIILYVIKQGCAENQMNHSQINYLQLRLKKTCKTYFLDKIHSKMSIYVISEYVVHISF